VTTVFPGRSHSPGGGEKKTAVSRKTNVFFKMGGRSATLIARNLGGGVEKKGGTPARELTTQLAGNFRNDVGDVSNPERVSDFSVSHSKNRGGKAYLIKGNSLLKRRKTDYKHPRKRGGLRPPKSTRMKRRAASR